MHVCKHTDANTEWDSSSTCCVTVDDVKTCAINRLVVLQAQLEGSHPELPREAPVLSKIMSPAAATELHWPRLPAVAIFGCFVADADGEAHWYTAAAAVHQSS